MPGKILIVEDNLDMRDLFHLYLTDEGFTVVTACDGREGLYMAGAEQPDLIITDIHMPDISGIDLIRQLRAKPRFKDTPIIAMTAYGWDDLDKAVRAGANRGIDKPSQLGAIVEVINELLNESSRK